MQSFTRSVFTAKDQVLPENSRIKGLVLRDLDAERLQILERSKEQAAAAEAQAWRDGHAKGYDEGRRQGLEQLAPHVGRLLELVESMATLRAELALRHEKELVGLALNVAERIVCTELDANAGHIKSIVSQAVSAVLDRESLVIKLNPLDLEIIEQVKSQIEAMPDVAGITLQPDSSMERGGCAIDTPSGSIDGRLRTRTAEISRLRRLVEESLDE